MIRICKNMKTSGELTSFCRTLECLLPPCSWSSVSGLLYRGRSGRSGRVHTALGRTHAQGQSSVDIDVLPAGQCACNRQRERLRTLVHCQCTRETLTRQHPGKVRGLYRNLKCNFETLNREILELERGPSPSRAASGLTMTRFHQDR